MNKFHIDIDDINRIIEKNPPWKEKSVNDYVENGILHCGNCHTPKQVNIEGYLMPCICKCMEEKYNSERQAIKNRERMVEIEHNRQSAFCDREIGKFTFDHDDGKNHVLSKLCRNYAKKFTPDSKWLLLYGGTGVGKTFMAACIANAVLDAGYSVKFATVSELERMVWDAQVKTEMYDSFARCGLLVIDDIGAERGSQYMTEVLFNVIDRRLRIGKPLVATTNIPPDQIFKPTEVTYERIMSRLLERSIPYKCQGSDRRIDSLRKNASNDLESLLSDD